MIKKELVVKISVSSLVIAGLANINPVAKIKYENFKSKEADLAEELV